MSEIEVSINKPDSNKLIKERDAYRDKILFMNKEIERMRLLTCELNKTLWKCCDHKWLKIEGAYSDDLCKRYCEKCNLYDNPMLYEK